VQSYLTAKGLHVDLKQIQAAVQSAYEMSMLTPTVNSNESESKKADTEQEVVVPAGTVKAIDPKEVA
ncbi:hypothetical protein DKZ22_12525, partial [Limosilactobacillus reuteri]